MKFIDLKDKEISELKKMLVEKKSELFELKLKLKTMQLNNPSQIAVVRKDIARLNTAISAKKD
ncbi:50S ribosomal protein L29 [Helicobacter cappadocius]|uniref:Large ribosomal subunit protein uL29 n=1 Tax=Helicobacter cappadocius TaxID=3063998 RepID=A0AA90PR87_9HELI|nr:MULTISPECIES: 50S ribosomal protein L29 [unclassified Helicobacter]MDO7253514.1 50S ribosomal protein L29 [Helicobacter sp. faydin-H75]MDP2539441.1 50S ribosomal protein L29 [Helicobacter sp. faydin-H76]